ncbi:17421_t:CDS:2, partial [Racocetra persica]
ALLLQNWFTTFQLGFDPTYLQLYVYDTQQKLSDQTNAIPNFSLNLATIQLLKNILDKVNSYIINFCHISRLSTKSIRNLAIIIRANIPELDLRIYNTSTASQVAAVWVDDEVPSNVIQKCDIVLHTNMDQLIHISEFNGCYEPLAYPIIFSYSEQGYTCDNNVENSDLDNEINEVSNDNDNNNSEPETNQTRNNENSS